MERDHVDLHMVIPLKYAVSRVVETLKNVTSRQLQEKFPHVLSKVYWMVAESGHEGFSPPRWASTRPRIGTMSSTKASSRRVKRSLNCKEPTPVRAGFFMF